LQKKSNSDNRLYGLIILVILLVLASGPGVAEEKSPVPEGDKAVERIHIASDRLVSEARSQTAEFIGNVRATQGNTVITAERLKIYLNRGPGEKKSGTEKESIKKIVADGNVTIKMDDIVAVTDRAVYIAKTDVLILTGTNSKITSEKDSVSGDKITLYRADDRMIVDGSGKERVEAILYTQDKGIK